jgi:hypothetical protein
MMNFSTIDVCNEGNPVSNMATAAFTTSHTRLRLLSIMRKLGERVLYYDTDPVMYVSRPGDEEMELGDILSDSDSRLKEG